MTRRLTMRERLAIAAAVLVAVGLWALIVGPGWGN
jgi:hypothetical protein